ncbi:MAG: PLP-dependent aminotransferase family protein [Pseudomonadota bacterium]
MVDALRHSARRRAPGSQWLASFPPSGVGSRASQLAEQLRQALAAGVLRPGDRLPPSRQLAAELALARGTVVAALEQLTAEGLVDAVVGSGTFIAAAAALARRESRIDRHAAWQAPRQVPAAPAVDAPLLAALDFRPCRPGIADFPVNLWRRALSWAARSRPGSDYGDPRGDGLLREALSDYLRRARGLALASDDLMVTNGAVHAMHVIAQVYLAGASEAAGARQSPVAVMEDPGFPLARQLFAGAGARIHDAPVDDEGLRIDALPEAAQDVRLVYVTAANQFPTGVRLSLSRRQALIAWARQAGALIVEDDYDGEFRYDVEPLPPLAAVGAGQVAYCGSFSKTLFPDLRLGFVAAHEQQIELLARYRIRTDYTGNRIAQRALAWFIAEGHYERHIHRMRRRYSAKRQLVVETLERLALPLRLLGTQSGLNVTVAFDAPVQGLDAQGFVARARQRQVLIPSLDLYQHANRARTGVVLGYAALDHGQIERGLARAFAP